MKTIKIVWQRLEDEAGQGCPRCRATEPELHKAMRFLTKALLPLGIVFSLETRPLNRQEFHQNPLESNRLWVDRKPLEQWLKAEVGASPCSEVCGEAGCRTLTVDGKTLETIPAELIIQAALQSVAREVHRLNAGKPGRK
jgi:hypothetical protein